MSIVKRFCQTHRFYYTEAECPFCYKDKNKVKFKRLEPKEKEEQETEETYQNSLENLIKTFQSNQK